METRRTIEEKIKHGNSINIEELNINGEKFCLKIDNQNEGFSLGFYKDKSSIEKDDSAEYEIIIDGEGIRFRRYVHRLNHDHDDIESLQVVTDPGKEDMSKKGDLVWRSRFPYEGEGYKLFYLPFRSKKTGC